MIHEGKKENKTVTAFFNHIKGNIFEVYMSKNKSKNKRVIKSR